MSLIITGQSTSYAMNVIAFSSPIYGQINTAQTKSLAVHFPIKMSQPVLQFDVQFSSEQTYQAFQAFVRNHQQQLSTNATALLTFTWPVRAILNFTGFISQFQAGGKRFNPAPRARFVVNLVDSYITARTNMASLAANWRSIYGGIGLPNGVLAAPTAAQQQQNITSQGINLLTGQPVAQTSGGGIVTGT